MKRKARIPATPPPAVRDASALNCWSTLARLIADGIRLDKQPALQKCFLQQAADKVDEIHKFWTGDLGSCLAMPALKCGLQVLAVANPEL